MTGVPKRLKALVIEDRTDDAEATILALEAGGYAVDWSRVDTETAFLAALDASVDVVLAGCNVPSFDVMRVLELARATGLLVPIIVVSGMISEELAVDCVRRGVADWVLKDGLARLPQAVVQAIEAAALRKADASALDELRRGQERLARAQRVAQVGSWTWDVLSDIVTWSDELYSIYGLTPAAFSASYTGFLDRVHPDDRAPVEAAVAATYQSGGAFEFDHRVVRPDGSIRVMHSRGEAVRDATGATVTMVGTGQDVTVERAREAKLAETQVRLAEAQRLARLGSWQYEIASRTLEWSPELYAIYGLDPTSHVPTLEDFVERIHPTDAPALQDLLHRAQESGEGWEGDLRILRPDGEERIMHGRAEVDLDEQGKPVRIRGTRHDVTDQRRHEARLREAEERFRLAFEEAPIGIALMAPDGRWLRVNRVLCDIFGYAQDQMLSLTSQDITHPDDLAADREHVRQMLAGEIATYQMDKRYYHSSGQAVWTQLNVSLVRDEQGEPFHFVAHIQDITLRKATEAQLRESEERFRRLASSAPIGIFQTDAVGRCTYANQAWATICGVASDVFTGREWTSVVHADDIEGTGQAWGHAIEGLVPFEHRFRADVCGGEACWVDVRLVPLPSEKGRPPEWVGTAIDVTFLIQANRAIAEARDRAVSESQLKSQFLANVSHEIRTPMNGVVGTAELLSDSPLSDSQRIHVDALRSAASSLMAVLNDVLDFSKIAAGKLVLDPASFHLPTLVSDTMALFAAIAQTKGIDLDTRRAPGREWLRGDAARIRQVLANLLGNAVKFTERGEVVLIVEESAGGGCVRFQVVDTGIGIPDDVAARLMRPFEQGDSSTTRRFGGSGLGLVICHELVGLMGGNLSFTSIPGLGTTFTLELPLPTAEPADIDTRASIPALTTAPGAAGRVLVAEDSPINQLVARAMLERLGWDVDMVGNGQAAVEAVARGVYDLVILDCQMPVLDGYQAARAIRSLPGSAGRSSIIAMTASAVTEERQRCLDSGMDDYIAKPVTRDGLAEVLHRATHP